MTKRDLQDHVIVVGFLLELAREPDPEGESRVREMMGKYPNAKDDPALLQLFNRVQTYRNDPTPENMREVMKAARSALKEKP